MASNFNPHFKKQMARTEPGPGADKPYEGISTPPKSKGIPHASTKRLQEAQFGEHAEIHTMEGMRAHDGPRRSLIDRGVRNKMIGHELELRGAEKPFPDCKFC